MVCERACDARSRCHRGSVADGADPGDRVRVAARIRAGLSSAGGAVVLLVRRKRCGVRAVSRNLFRRDNRPGNKHLATTRHATAPARRCGQSRRLARRTYWTARQLDVCALRVGTRAGGERRNIGNREHRQKSKSPLKQRRLEWGTRTPTIRVPPARTVSLRLPPIPRERT